METILVNKSNIENTNKLKINLVNMKVITCTRIKCSIGRIDVFYLKMVKLYDIASLLLPASFVFHIKTSIRDLLLISLPVDETLG